MSIILIRKKNESLFWTPHNCLSIRLKEYVLIWILLISIWPQKKKWFSLIRTNRKMFWRERLATTVDYSELINWQLLFILYACCNHFQWTEKYFVIDEIDGLWTKTLSKSLMLISKHIQRMSEFGILTSICNNVQKIHRFPYDES